MSPGSNVALVVNNNGQPVTLTGATGATTTSNATTVNYQVVTPQGGIITEQAVISSNGSGTLSATQNGQTTQQTFANAAQEYGEVGQAFGSSLGRVLAGSNAFAQISTSTVLGALGEQLAAALGVAVNGADATTTLDTFLNGTAPGPAGTPTANGGFVDSLETSGAGAVGAYLVGELVSAIGLTGAPAQIVDSFAGQTVGQIATNIIRNGISGWNNGIDDPDISNIAGGFIGTELGNLVYSASTVQGEEGASVGSAVGGVIGSFIPIPVLGTAIGSFVGDIIGGLIGDLFGEPTISAISLASVHASGSATTPLSYSFTTSLYQNGSQASANSIGDAVSGALNGILSTVGGVVSNEPSLTQFTVGINTDARLGQVFYYDDNTTGIRTQYQASDTTLQWVVDYSTLRELSEMQFSGGDAYIERAIDAALRSAPYQQWVDGGPVTPQDPAMTTLSGDIQIAKDYETYEENKTVIDALIQANPTSDFSVGWITELAIAAQMGFGTSLQGGAGNDVMTADSTHNVLIGGGGSDTYDYATGQGQVTILNGVSSYNTPTGALALTNANYSVGGVTFAENGADLVITFAGDTTDRVTVEGWFAGSFAQLNSINFANGVIIANSDIQNYAGTFWIDNVDPPGQGRGTKTDNFAASNLGIESTNNLQASGSSLTGGVGADALVGTAGNETFYVGGGNDIAYGAGGSDSYILDNPGLLTIYNGVGETGAVASSAAAGALVLGDGVTASELSFAKSGNDLDISVAGSSSAVTVKNWFASAYAQLSDITTSDGNTIYYSTSGGGEFWYEDTAFPYGIHSYVFWNVAGLFISQEYYYDADGNNYETATQNTATLWTYGLEANIHISIGIDGDTFNVTAAGSDTLAFAASNATLSLTGSSGDTINVTSGSSDVINASGDTITLASSIIATIDGNSNTINGGTGDIIIIGGSTGDVITSTSGVLEMGVGSQGTLYGDSNTIYSIGDGFSLTLGGQSDIFYGNSNTLTLAASATATINGSSDTITGASGDVITLSGGTGNVIDTAGGSNETLSLSGASDENLWLVRSGNDLRIDFMGTQNAVTIAGWFSSSNNQLQEITAGGLKLDAQVSALVAAMASYSAGHTGFDPTAISQAPNDNTLQTAIAAAWHA